MSFCVRRYSFDPEFLGLHNSIGGSRIDLRPTTTNAPLYFFIRRKEHVCAVSFRCDAPTAYLSTVCTCPRPMTKTRSSASVGMLGRGLVMQYWTRIPSESRPYLCKQHISLARAVILLAMMLCGPRQSFWVSERAARAVRAFGGE